MGVLYVVEMLTFIVTGDKGEITSGWANLPQYRVSRLFEKASYCLEYASGEEAGCFLVSDLTIEDNEAPSNGNLPDFVFMPSSLVLPII
jgi:hypothetical protein